MLNYKIKANIKPEDIANGSNKIKVKAGAGLMYNNISEFVVEDGDILISDKYSGTSPDIWWHMPLFGGWISGEKFFQVLGYESFTPNITPPTIVDDQTNQTQAEWDNDIDGEIERITNVESDDSNIYVNEIVGLFRDEGSMSNAYMGELKSTWGMPFQFIPTTDNRLSDIDFGRKYYENIVLNMPLLSVIPGKPVFMKGQSKKIRDGVLGSLKDVLEDNDRFLDKNTLSEIMDGKYGMYYSFESDFTSYMQYVNRMANQAAVYLGIGDKKVPNTDKLYRSMDWYDYQINHGNYSVLQNTLGFGKMVTFFIDSSSSMVDSASNDTTESKLTSMSQEASDAVREATFIFGSKIPAEYENVVNDFTDANSFMPRLTDTVKTLGVGANILFPEIWNNSSYSKSYNVTVRLHSPYGDIESVYLNIFLPLFHLITLCLPRQLPTAGATGYVSPFLVRAYCRSLFNCSLGIVDSLSFTKAPNNEWTIDGLPTEVEVNFSVKDMYSSLMMYSGSKSSVFFSNTALVDFIGNICGVNTYKKDLTRSVESYIAYTSGTFKRRLPTTWRGLQENVKNKLFLDKLNF